MDIHGSSMDIHRSSVDIHWLSMDFTLIIHWLSIDYPTFTLRFTFTHSHPHLHLHLDVLRIKLHFVLVSSRLVMRSLTRRLRHKYNNGDFVLGCGIIAGAGPDVWFCCFDLVMFVTDKWARIIQCSRIWQVTQRTSHVVAYKGQEIPGCTHQAIARNFHRPLVFISLGRTRAGKYARAQHGMHIAIPHKKKKIWIS